MAKRAGTTRRQSAHAESHTALQRSRTKWLEPRFGRESTLFPLTVVTRRKYSCFALSFISRVSTANGFSSDAQTIERKPIRRRAPEARVDVPESADVDTIVEQLKSDMERLAKQTHEEVMISAKQNHHQIAATLGATQSTMRQESKARFARVEAKIERNTNALEAMQTRIHARIDAHKNNNSSSSSRIREGNEQNAVRAVATNFTESSTEEEVREFLQGVIKGHAMEETLEDTHCPAKLITHALLQFQTEESKQISPKDNNAPSNRVYPIQTRFEP